MHSSLARANPGLTFALIALIALSGCGTAALPPLRAPAASRCIARSIDAETRTEHTWIIADYDRAGRLVRLEHRYLEDPFVESGAIQTFGYTAGNRLAWTTSTQHGEGESFTARETYRYDDLGRLAQVLEGSRPIRSYAYDPEGTAITYMAPTGAVGATGRVVTSATERTTTWTPTNGAPVVTVETRDPSGRVLHSINTGPDGTVAKHYRYDSAGSILEESDESSATEYRRMNGRAVASTMYYEGQRSLETTYTYRGPFAHRDCVVDPRPPR